MAANKKPRKKYKPKPVLRDPIRYVVAGVKPPDAGLMMKIDIINHSAMESLTRGNGTQADWQIITNMLNVACVMAGAMGLEEVEGDNEHIIKALAAHTNCGRRKLRNGLFGYTGPELMAVNTAFAIHDWQMQNTTVIQYERANREVDRRIAAGNIDFSIKKELANDPTT